MAITIRPARQEDQQTIVSFVRQAKINPRNLHWERFLVAEENGAFTGCVYIEPRKERTYLGLLSVDPELQKAGLGSQLLSAAENFSRQRGSFFMDIYVVNLREDLPSYYSKRGYIQTGTTPFPEDVPTKVPCFFINMSKAL